MICNRQSKQLAALMALLLLLGSLFLKPALADDKDRRRELLGGILRIVVESQSEQHRHGDRGRVSAPPPPAQLGAVSSRELISARVTLESYRLESAALNAQLQQDAVANPALRGILNDSLKFQARADAVSIRSRAVIDHRSILGEIELLDREWRTLGYRLQQAPRLSKSCRDSLVRMDQHNNSLCQQLAIEPSIDRRVLVREAEGLTTHLRSLVEDVAFEARSVPNGRELVLESGRAQQAAAAFADAAQDRTSFRSIVEHYQHFLGHWSPLSQRLCALKSRNVEREIVHIQQADQRIREMLWLPRSLNRELINQLAAGLLSDADRLFDSIDLRLLVQIPTAKVVPGAASDFFGYCQHFADSAQHNQRIEDLVDAYDELPTAWVGFSQHFRNVPHPALQQTLQAIEQRIISLREPLGIPNGFDRDEARRRAAALEHATEHFSRDLDTWIASRPGTDPERRAIVELSAKLRSSSQQLHAALVHGVPDASLEAISAAMYSQWASLHQRLTDSKAPDREHVIEVLLQVGHELVQIDALFLS